MIRPREEVAVPVAGCWSFLGVVVSVSTAGPGPACAPQPGLERGTVQGACPAGRRPRGWGSSDSRDLGVRAEPTQGGSVWLQHKCSLVPTGSEQGRVQGVSAASGPRGGPRSCFLGNRQDGRGVRGCVRKPLIRASAPGLEMEPDPRGSDAPGKAGMFPSSRNGQSLQ